MLFNSYIFILLFLPLCLVCYFALNHFKKYNLAMVLLLIMSLWFYGYFNYSYLFIIITSIIVNYLIYRGFDKIGNKKSRKLLLILGIIFNLGMIFYFKYFNFFFDNINAVFKTNFNFEKVLLPLGISFFTFQQLSFVIDSYKREIPKYSFLNYACFVTYFPQLIAGPIVTHDELVPQFMDKEKKKFNFENFSKGVYIFALGLAKKILIADVFGSVVDLGFTQISTLNSTNLIIIMLSYTIQIYFDFSGYCDMAIGLGKMMNIDLPINFNSPYKSFTIVEFWKRWHITLTRFFTKYVYIPLGGNRKGKLRTYINIMIVFTLSGLWHGANWTFIVWGMMHGLFLVITRHFKNFFEKMHSALSWIITFLFVNVAWVFFRADSIHQALVFFKRILLGNYGIILDTIRECFYLPEFKLILNQYPFIILKQFSGIVMIMYFAFVLLIILGSKNAYEKMNEFKPSYRKLFITIFLLVWCIVSFSGVSKFLYFNF